MDGVTIKVVGDGDILVGADIGVVESGRGRHKHGVARDNAIGCAEGGNGCENPLVVDLDSVEGGAVHGDLFRVDATEEGVVDWGQVVDGVGTEQGVGDNYQVGASHIGIGVVGNTVQNDIRMGGVNACQSTEGGNNGTGCAIVNFGGSNLGHFSAADTQLGRLSEERTCSEQKQA